VGALKGADVGLALLSGWRNENTEQPGKKADEDRKETTEEALKRTEKELAERTTATREKITK
jgi:hypothetical protein